MKNMQSAEEAYKELDKIKATNEQLANDLKAAQDRLATVEKANQESDLNTQIEALKRTVAEQEKTIRGYQDLNQKLFLQIGKPVDEKPPIDEEEKATQEERQRILDKIKQQRESDKESNQ